MQQVVKAIEAETVQYRKAVRAVEKAITDKKREFDNLVAAVARGANVDLYNEAIEVRRKEIEGLEKEKEKLAVSQPALDKIDAQRLREYIQSFNQVLAYGSNHERRDFIRTFVRRIEFDPANRRITIIWYADPLQAKNFEAPGYLNVRVFTGVGGGT